MDQIRSGPSGGVSDSQFHAVIGIVGDGGEMNSMSVDEEKQRIDGMAVFLSVLQHDFPPENAGIALRTIQKLF